MVGVSFSWGVCLAGIEAVVGANVCASCCKMSSFVMSSYVLLSLCCLALRLMGVGVCQLASRICFSLRRRCSIGHCKLLHAVGPSLRRFVPCFVCLRFFWGIIESLSLPLGG